MKHYPCTMTIAGSDSGGGAGAQADIKVMTTLGTFVTSAFTVMTAQNGLGIHSIYPLPVSFIQEQITSIFQGFPIKALKTGMLFSAEIIDTVASALRKESQCIKVIDPVCVCSNHGDKLLLDAEALSLLKTKLLPLADIITPNKREAEVLTDIQINNEHDVYKAIDILSSMGAKAIFLKGGSLASTNSQMIDWLYAPVISSDIIPLPHAYIQSTNIHGTGCATGAAITAFLAKGYNILEAVQSAQSYIITCLEQSYTQGQGVGSPNHVAVTKYIV